MTSDIATGIENIKNEMDRELVILGHHYQSDRIIRHTDIQGDSLELARKIGGLSAKNIVFCGVHFMAETAAVLAEPEQSVFLPEQSATCVMADMAPASVAEKILTRLNREGRKIVPVAYVNSSLAIKNMCGKFGGSVCTSANAKTMLAWALDRGDGVLFLPDKHLGRNVADDLGVCAEDREILDIRSGGKYIDYAKAGQKKMFFWPGLCAVHHRLKPEHLKKVRQNDPGAKIIVHPECMPEVVALADAKGSTSMIMDFVRQAAPGSTIYVGTEENMVRRLAADYAPEKTVKPIYPTFCSNMAKITPEKLLYTLNYLNPENRIIVEENAAAQAKKALQIMLEVCS